MTVVVIIILASALAGVARAMMERGRALGCAKNLRQIGMATMAYASDNRMTLPLTSHQRGGKSWSLTLKPYMETGADVIAAFKCPDDADKTRTYTYLINDFLTPNPAGAPDLNYSYLASIPRPEATLMFAEAAATNKNTDHLHFSDYRGGKMPPEVFAYQVAVEEHAGKANYLFADGHVETLGWGEVRSKLAADGSPFIDPSVR